MGTPSEPEPVALFAALMWSPHTDAKAVEQELIEAYGPVAYRCGPVAFTFTEYYEREMGSGLRKSYLLFADPVARDALPSVKRHTNDIEARLSHDGNRGVNIDPGYLARDKLVLASTKDFYHRLYLGKGIYGEVTLHFRNGAWRHFSWTYRDYRLPEVQQLLTRARAKLVFALRKGGTQSRR